MISAAQLLGQQPLGHAAAPAHAAQHVPYGYGQYAVMAPAAPPVPTPAPAAAAPAHAPQPALAAQAVTPAVDGASLWPVHISRQGARYADRVRAAPMNVYTPRSAHTAEADAGAGGSAGSVAASTSELPPSRSSQPQAHPSPHAFSVPPSSVLYPGGQQAAYPPPAAPAGYGRVHAHAQPAAQRQQQHLPAGMRYGAAAPPSVPQYGAAQPAAFSSPYASPPRAATTGAGGVGSAAVLMSPIVAQGVGAGQSQVPPPETDPQHPSSLGALLGAVTSAIMMSAPRAPQLTPAQRRAEEVKKRAAKKKEMEELTRERTEAERKTARAAERHERLLLKHTLMRAKLMSKQAMATAQAMQQAAAEARREMGGMDDGDELEELGLDESLARAKRIAAAAQRAAAEMRERAANLRQQQRRRRDREADRSTIDDGASYRSDARSVRSSRGAGGGGGRAPGSARGKWGAVRRQSMAVGAQRVQELREASGKGMGDKKPSALARFAGMFTTKSKDGSPGRDGKDKKGGRRREDGKSSRRLADDRSVASGRSGRSGRSQGRRIAAQAAAAAQRRNRSRADRSSRRSDREGQGLSWGR